MLKKAFIITLFTSNAAYSMQPNPAETARAHAELENNKNLILCSHYCPGKNRLASLDGTANITVWNTQSPYKSVLQINAGDIPAGLASRSDGNILASTSKQIKTWDSSTGKEINTFGSGGFAELEYAPNYNENMLAAQALAASDGVSIWDAKEGKLIQKLVSKGKLNKFSPDGKKLVTSCQNVVQIWDLAQNKIVHTVEPQQKINQSKIVRQRINIGNFCPITYNNSGTQLAVAASNRVYIYDTRDYSLKGTLTGNGLWLEEGDKPSATDEKSTPFSLAYHPHNDTLAIGYALLADVYIDNDMGFIAFVDTKSKSMPYRISSFDREGLTHNIINSLQFNNDGDQLQAGSMGGELMLWSIAKDSLKNVALAHVLKTKANLKPLFYESSWSSWSCDIQ